MGVEELTLIGDDGVSLPYAGTSGWSGSSTSRARAVTADASGETSYRQSAALFALFQAGPEGMTWKELGDKMGWHHGTASGALSVLHKDAKIARLTETRDRCKVYVHLYYVDEREVEAHGRKVKPCSNCGHVESP
jgi:hypothetical protein